MRLIDKHVVVTGAGRGIGQALAVAVAAEGAAVTCLDIDGGTAAETASFIRAQGRKSFAVTCNTANMREVENALQHALAALGPISVLVANAGGAAGERTPFLEITSEKWQGMLDRNLTGAFYCGQVFGRYLAAHGGGAIVFTSSIAAQFAAPELAHYAAAKGGVHMLMRGMALELARYKVRVNAVAPGVILTPGNRDVINTPGVMEQLTRNVPMGRVAGPKELAGAVIYLVSDEASYTTGTTITIDGGLTLQ